MRGGCNFSMSRRYLTQRHRGHREKHIKSPPAPRQELRAFIMLLAGDWQIPRPPPRQELRVCQPEPSNRGRSEHLYVARGGLANPLPSAPRPPRFQKPRRSPFKAACGGLANPLPSAPRPPRFQKPRRSPFKAACGGLANPLPENNFKNSSVLARFLLVKYNPLKFHFSTSASLF